MELFRLSWGHTDGAHRGVQSEFNSAGYVEVLRKWNIRGRILRGMNYEKGSEKNFGSRSLNEEDSRKFGL